ncbi:YitT family protein [Paenibacillus antri]|uniref:YitT family protein n=1 Tax=Paenibacillus antri TaxID=2582848 RepID=A0A5R9GCP7_9BACL|nr:YitT family protein [Paenibacillus antri]TLS54252.1 YitT family protein [Paenibacillus antri]
MTTRARTVRECLSIIGGAVLIAAGFNGFLIPHQLLSGGVSGISMLIGYVAHWNIGWLYLVLNLPLFIWGWVLIGKRFVVLSFLSVIATVVAMQLIPETRFNQDPTIASVFGGVLVGIGTGLSFRAGGSTGGFDIIGSIVLRKYDFPLGEFLFGLNGVVIVALGLMERNWDLALYSTVSIFVTGKVIDVVHTRHVKITAFIVSTKKDEMLAKLLAVPRGVTVIKTQGGYSQSDNHMLMTVTTRYELQGLLKTVRDIDPNAFVNMVETVGVMGLFRRE